MGRFLLELDFYRFQAFDCHLNLIAHPNDFFNRK